MRPSLWIALIPLALFVGVAAPSGAPAATVAPAADTVKVTGYGETERDAADRAREKARDVVAEFLQTNYPAIGWEPTAPYLVEKGVVHLDPAKEGTFNGLQGYEATAEVHLTDPYLQKMQSDVDRAREQRLGQTLFQRHVFAARILAALVALFLVIAGYLRLEEMTRGYYTALLRLGAGAVVLLAAAGLFLLF